MSGDPTPPAPCPGTDPYNLNTALLLAWWVTREYLQKPTINGLAIATALVTMITACPLGAGAVTLLACTGLAAFYICVGAGVAAVHLAAVRRWARVSWVAGYFTPDASQLVHPEGGAWVLSEHHARHRGRGLGASLRAVVWPHLMSEADLAGVAIRMDTRVPALAEQYVKEMPGLAIVGTRRGVTHLARQPSLEVGTRPPAPGPGYGSSPQRRQRGGEPCLWPCRTCQRRDAGSEPQADRSLQKHWDGSLD